MPTCMLHSSLHTNHTLLPSLYDVGTIWRDSGCRPGKLRRHRAAALIRCSNNHSGNTAPTWQQHVVSWFCQSCGTWNVTPTTSPINAQPWMPGTSSRASGLHLRLPAQIIVATFRREPCGCFDVDVVIEGGGVFPVMNSDGSGR